jgi:hypothetical protein
LEAALEGRVQVDPVEQLLSLVAEVSSYLGSILSPADAGRKIDTLGEKEVVQELI